MTSFPLSYKQFYIHPTLLTVIKGCRYVIIFWHVPFNFLRSTLNQCLLTNLFLYLWHIQLKYEKVYTKLPQHNWLAKLIYSSNKEGKKHYEMKHKDPPFPFTYLSCLTFQIFLIPSTVIHIMIFIFMVTVFRNERKKE